MNYYHNCIKYNYNIKINLNLMINNKSRYIYQAKQWTNFIICTNCKSSNTIFLSIR